MLRDLLRADGVMIGREKLATLIQRTGIKSIYRRANAFKPAAWHNIYPCLRGGLKIDRPNQVWTMGITSFR